MGMLGGLSFQVYARCLLPNMTIDQHKLFWLAMVGLSYLISKIGYIHAKPGKSKMVYKFYSIIFLVIEALLIINYCTYRYISFQWL